MPERRCEKCEWWAESSEKKMKGYGDCRIGRPKALSGWGGDIWPVTREHEWCGEFKEKQDG